MQIAAWNEKYALDTSLSNVYRTSEVFRIFFFFFFKTKSGDTMRMTSSAMMLS